MGHLLIMMMIMMTMMVLMMMMVTAMMTLGTVLCCRCSCLAKRRGPRARLRASPGEGDDDGSDDRGGGDLDEDDGHNGGDKDESDDGLRRRLWSQV